MTHTEPANPKGRSDEEIRADLDAWENAEPAWNIDDRVYLDKLSDRLVDDVAPLLAALAAARSDADQLRTENERLRGSGIRCGACSSPLVVELDEKSWAFADVATRLAAAGVEVDRLEKLVETVVATANGSAAEVDTLRAKIAALIDAARRDHDAASIAPFVFVDELVDVLAGAVPGSPPEPTADGPWAVDLLDCGRDDGVQVCATWAEADDFRQSYVVAAEGKQHCERQAIIHRAVAGTRLGYHDRAPYFAAGPVVPGSPETRQEDAAKEQPMDGAELIRAERQRQTTFEGWTPEHDAEHKDDSLVAAAHCYLWAPKFSDPVRSATLIRYGPHTGLPWAPSDWPWEARAWKPTPDDRVRELVKAGALIAAEIDRLAAVGGSPETPATTEETKR